MKLVAIILTYNEAAHIQACIESVRFADSILVVDSFSTDETVKIATASGVKVAQRKFDHYAGQRNAALEIAAQDGADWVLFVDADERVSPELAEEIRASLSTDKAGFKIPRHNYIFGKLTLWAGWYPDHQMRLLRVGKAYYDPERQVHEVVILDGAEGTLNHPFIHYNYLDLALFIQKQRRYTRYEAQILFEQGICPKPQNYILQPLRQFWWRFVTLGGYRDGLHGMRLSLLMGWYEFQKYVILRGLCKK